MKKIIKNLGVVVSIFIIATIITLVVCNRMEELNKSDKILSTNTSLAINFSK